MNPPDSAGRRGFTLIEVIVVIAIIAALAGISVPIVRSMIARSQQATCLSKLRSVGIGLQAYLQDHAQKMPPIEAGRSSKSEDVMVLETALQPYLTDEEAFHCEADHHSFDKTGSSYAWNSTQSGRHVADLFFFGETHRTNRIPLVFDKEDWHPRGVNILYADLSTSNEFRFTVDR